MATVLIIDDVKTDRELLGGVVTKAGHRVVYGDDGEKAAALAKEHKPAMIFMDVVMPGLNGFNACRKLKQDPEIASIPIILVTSKGTESDKFWGKKQGADDHITKPFTPDLILEAVRRHAR